MKRLFAALAIATFVSAACGSSDDGNLNHQTCTPGDTRTCVGPGACNGGQVCGSDGNWGGCDCGGGTGGNAGYAGQTSGGSGGAAPDGGGASGGQGGTAGVAGGGGSGATTGGAAGSAGASGDDPCYTPLTCDYTKTCDPNAPDCVSSMCHTLALLGDPVPRSVRLPAHPANCCPGSFVAHVAIDDGVIAVARVTVSPPWYVEPWPGGAKVCSPPAGASCLIDLNGSFLVFTTDPDAPARNLLIESVPLGTTCP